MRRNQGIVNISAAGLGALLLASSLSMGCADAMSSDAEFGASAGSGYGEEGGFDTGGLTGSGDGGGDGD